MSETKIEWAGLPRTVDPRGYVLIRMPSHHRADIRGYVYEHALVAEQMIGRPLQRGERVRHIDGAPGNNEPDNLRVITPVDRTEQIDCACGCGATLARFDNSGRERRHFSGHNPQASPLRDAILATLAASPLKSLSPQELAETAGTTRGAATMMLSKAASEGLVERARVGFYRLPGSTAAFPPPVSIRPKFEWGSALSDDYKESWLENFGGRCAYGCGRKAAVWDHLIPWSRGGSFRFVGNAVPACVTCNSAKNNSAPGPWVARALAAGYSADAMLNIVELAVSWGMAAPEDFDFPVATEAVAR